MPSHQDRLPPDAVRVLLRGGPDSDEWANPFVGRQHELGEIRAAMSSALAGRGRLLFLTGGPGIGKTSLAEEAAVHAAWCGMRVYWGRCFEDGGAPAYWPWIQVLRRVIADAGSQFPRTLPADIVRMLPELAAEAPQPEAGDAEQARFRLFDAVATLLKEAAQANPILLMLDDLHEGDLPSLQMLKFIARATHDAHILILATYRGAEMRRSAERMLFLTDILREGRELPLAGLGEVEIARMVEMRAQRPPDPDFVTALSRTTAGNPLFVNGIVRVLAAEGRFGSAQPIALASYKLPDEVRAAIQRWLGLLSPEARTLLTTAALMGPEFELGLLGKATATAPERVAELIAGAHEMGIASSAGKSLCRFTHPLLREALSAEPTTSERVRLHRAIALALEEMRSDDLRPYFSVLAYHWRESARSPEEIDKAIDYSLRAGDAAAKAFALREAVSCWEDALHLNEEHRQINPQRAEILVRLGHALPVRGQQVLKSLEDALAIYEQLGMTSELADVHMQLSEVLESPLVDLPRAEEHFRKAEALLRQMPPNASLVRLYGNWCEVCVVRANISEGFEAASHAVEIAADALDYPSGRARAGHAMSESLFAMGRLRECLEWEERAWEEADKLGDASLASGITVNAMFLLRNLCAYQEASRWSEREIARPRNQRSGGFYEAFGGFRQQIIGHSAMGGLSEVRQLMSERTYLQSFGEPLLKFWAGDLEEAGAGWTGLVAYYRNQQRWENVCEEGSFLAHIRRLASHYDTAENLLKEGLVYSVPGGYVPMEMLGRQGLSQLYAETGRTEEARANLARCREIMAAGEDWHGVVGLISLSEAAIAAAEQRFDEADLHFADALQIIRRYAIRWIEGPSLCDWGRALSSRGQRDRALEKFDEAIELYRRIGAGQPWIDRAKAERAGIPAASALPAKMRKTPFHREGNASTITYEGHIQRLRDVKGLSYNEESQRVVATLLFIDIVSSTEHVTKLRDRGWVELRKSFFELIRKQLASFNGLEIDAAGDGMLAIFDHPAAAIHCALAMSRGVEKLGLQMRAGIHTGECELVGGAAIGIAVHIGARVASQAAATEVLVSSTVRDLLAGGDIRFVDRGTHVLKGVAGEWHLYAAQQPE